MVIYCWSLCLYGEYVLEEMGPSVDIDGFCARAPLLEFLRQDEKEVISSEMPRTGCIVINFEIIYSRSRG